MLDFFLIGGLDLEENISQKIKFIHTDTTLFKQHAQVGTMDLSNGKLNTNLILLLFF